MGEGLIFSSKRRFHIAKVKVNSFILHFSFYTLHFAIRFFLCVQNPLTQVSEKDPQKKRNNPP